MRENIDIKRITQTISDHQNSGRVFKSIIGFDGFVDELMQVVDTRENAEKFTKIKTLDAFGERISRSAGLSTNVELVGLVRKLGGNGPNLANAISELGVFVTYIGALGEASIHPVFEPMDKKCELISITDPGLAFNLEFDDGKLIMAKQDPLNKITWDALKERFGLARFAQMISDDELDLLGLVNWVLTPYLSGVFKGIIEEVFPIIEPKGKLAFFDLCDTEKRLKSDIVEALELIKKFSSHYKVTLGANLREATQVAAALDIEVPAPPSGTIEDIDLKDLTVRIGKALGIHCFVVHTVYDAAAYAEGEYHYTLGYYTPAPILTTGAGDNFNAGLCLGLLLGLTYSEALLLGTACSGYYVRKAKSADISGLLCFLENENEE